MKAIMYTKNGCKYCNNAKVLLASKQIQYEEINIQELPEKREELLSECKKIGVQPKTVPQIWIDGEYIGGFDDLKIKFDNTNH